MLTKRLFEIRDFLGAGPKGEVEAVVWIFRGKIKKGLTRKVSTTWNIGFAPEQDSP